MPLHISEIGVHVAVGNPEADPDPGAPAPAGHPTSPPVTQSRLRQIVSACVQRVLQALRLRQQR